MTKDLPHTIDISRPFMDYGARASMGFLDVSGETPVSNGSGIFVSFGSVKGILTCAHTLKASLKFNEVGILLFPAQSEVEQRLRMRQLDLSDNIVFGNNEEDENGPDLAFVRLPHTIMTTIEGRASIIDGEHQTAQWLGGEPAREAFGSLAFGILNEATAPTVKRDGHPATNFRAPLILGDVVEVGEANGLDLFRFQPRKELNDPPPMKSYGGMSGCGFWQIYMNADGTPVQVRLAGVIFYEKLVDGSLQLIGHGPNSIYGRLYQAIKEQWG